MLDGNNEYTIIFNFNTPDNPVSLLMKPPSCALLCQIKTLPMNCQRALEEILEFSSYATLSLLC